jgi:hypothetical protein
VRLSVCGAGLGLRQPGQQVNKKMTFKASLYRNVVRTVQVHV